MSDRYDFGNLSPIEFEALCVDLVSAETGLRFERFSAGPDGGVDGRHSSSDCNAILQAKHYKNSSWSDLQRAAKGESKNLKTLSPTLYYFATSQGLTPTRKDILQACLKHQAVDTSNIWGRTELNALLQQHDQVQKRNIKLWLSSSAVLERLLNNDVAVFTEDTRDEIERILKVYVANPSLGQAVQILNDKHCVIISGPPGVGKTTLAQVLAAEYCDDDWNLVAISSIDAGLSAFKDNENQVFVFDDFLGKIKLDEQSLAREDGKIARFFSMVGKRSDKRFILTSRAYILQAARGISEAIDERHIEITELVLDLSTYTREIKARILYNHLYHSNIGEDAIQALLSEGTVHRIVDHPNYMPRIIEWMTDHYRNSDVGPEDYPTKFLQMLDDPTKIWEKAFFKHISPAARVLLYCMYFSKSDIFPPVGIRASNLRSFFELAVVNFGVCQRKQLRGSFFEDVLKEIKSSFVVISGEKIKFINPSVQDFLNGAVKDKYVFQSLAASVPTYENASKLWTSAKQNFADDAKTKMSIATELLGAEKAGSIQGRMPLHNLADLIGDLILTSGQLEIVPFIRNGGLSDTHWIVESELPALIDDLLEGRFSDLTYAPAYARLLRRKLFVYLSDREYVLELEELGNLANNLTMSFCEYPEQFHEAFSEAASEVIECLNINDLRREDDHESTLAEWLENIEKIEGYAPEAITRWKKEELEEYAYNLDMRHEQEMSEYKDDLSLKRSASSGSPEPFPGRTGTSISRFSDADISAMFSSLKK